MELNKDILKVGKKAVEPVQPETQTQTIQATQATTEGSETPETPQEAPTEPVVKSCKICLCDEETEADPLISPCLCKGTCSLVHAGCLKNWINSKVKR